MARASVAGEGNSAPRNRTKVKTGCATCRARKVKCDEVKPFCQRCTNTGRKCDGYDSPFRAFTNSSVNDALARDLKPNIVSEPISPASFGVSPADIDLLNRCFSTKTILDVKLDCDEEARQILQASLTDPPMRHAISSLRTLREDLEISGDGPASTTHQTMSYNYGIEQYSMALGGLASNLAFEGPDGLKSALLCCQIFISIEELRKNYGSMAQHMIRGLRIMHEYRARPSLNAVNQLVPAYHEQLPLLDVFIIKMFAAPCKFADARTNAVETDLSICPLSSRTVHSAAREARKIAPDIRPGLVKIALSTLEFLDKVSQIQSVGAAVQLLSKKEALLDSLESWLMNLELIQTKAQPPVSEPVSTSFMRLLYLILKTTLLGALDSSPGLTAKIQVENDRLQEIAINLTERVRDYIRCLGSGSSQGSSPLSVDSQSRTA